MLNDRITMLTRACGTNITKGNVDRQVHPLPALTVHAGHHLSHLASNGDVRYRDVMIPLTEVEKRGSNKTHHFQRVRADRLKVVKQHSLAL